MIQCAPEQFKHRGSSLITCTVIFWMLLFDSGVAPSTIVVLSRVSKLQGIYEEIATYENFPVFAKEDMLLWHQADADARRRLFVRRM